MLKTSKAIKTFKLWSEERKIEVIFLFILIGGLILRLFQLGYQSYWIDEAFTLNAVQAVLDKGLPILDSGFHYFRSILNTYTVAGSVSLFGLNPWSARITSVIFGVGVIWVVYRLVKLLFENNKVALFTALFVAFSSIDIAWSRQSRMYSEFQFFFFFSLYLFYLMLEKFTKLRLVSLCITTILAILSHEFGLLLIPIYVVAYLLRLYGPLAIKTSIFEQKVKLYQSVKKYFWLILFFFAVVAPLAGMKVYQLVLARFVNSSMEDYSSGGQVIAGKFIQGFAVSYLWLIVVAIIGFIIYIFKEKDSYPAFFLLLSFAIPFYAIIFSTDLYNPRYLFFLYPLLYVWVAYCLATIFSWLTKIKLIKRCEYFFLILICLLVVISSPAMTIWPRSFYSLETETPQPNFNVAYEQIKKMGFNDQSIIVSPYPAMDKLYLGRNDYWLPVSLSGKEEELIPNKSIYTGSPKVVDLESLGSNQKNVFVIIDSMAAVRLGHEYLDYLSGLSKLKFVTDGAVVYLLK